MASSVRNILADYMDREQCQGLVDYHRANNCRVDGATGCWIYNALSVNGSGYPLVKAVPGLLPRPASGIHASKAFLLHRVSLVAKTGADINGVASHLCDVARCFNPDHLRDETPRYNESRKGCYGELRCAWHGHPLGNFCAHEPGCIRPPRDDLNCCLQLKESDPVGWDFGPSSSLERPAQSSGGATHVLPPAPQPPESQLDSLASERSETPSEAERTNFSPSHSFTRGSSPPHLALQLATSPSQLPSLSLMDRSLPGPNSRSPPAHASVASSSYVGVGGSSSWGGELPITGSDIPSPSGTVQQESSSSDNSDVSSSPQRARKRRRPDTAASTQHQGLMDTYFADEETNDTQYARDARALEHYMGSEVTESSWRPEGSD